MQAANKSAESCGYTLAELLFALVIFSTGLVFVMQWQLQAQRQQQVAYQIAHAAMHAYNLAAQWSMFETLPGDTRADHLFTRWAGQMGHGLPQGQGHVLSTGQLSQIQVSWAGTLLPAAVCSFDSSAHSCVLLAVDHSDAGA